MMEKSFVKEMLEKSYFKHHSRVVLALSGGLDSMTLLHLLYPLQEKLGIELVLAHVNHGQRLESADEEQGVKELALQLDLPIRIAYFTGVFSEEAARQFRYTFFEEVMKTEKCTALVTAHHADDQAETILMRLIRGSRLRHLVSIKPVQSFGGGELIRPLLNFHKEEFPKIFHFEDRSNFSNLYFRNRVRNIYIPQLSKENPQFTKALLALRKEISQQTQALKDLTHQMNIQEMKTFHQQSFAVQSYLLESYLENFPELQLSRVQFQEVLQILRTKANYSHHLKGDYFLEKDYESFEIKKISPKSDSKIESYLLQFGNTLEIGEFRFSFGLPLSDPLVEVIHVSRETKLILRHRHAGDKILLNGHHKKLRRLFIDQKVSQKKRKETIIVEQDGEILSLVGIAVGDLSKCLKNDIMSEKLYIQKIDR